MRLALGSFPVKRIEFGPTTIWHEGTLHVDRSALRAHLLGDERLVDVEIDCARPGESARIIHVLDSIEPRAKVEGRGQVFPGIVGPLEAVGDGRTHRLAGLAVQSTAVIRDPRETADVWESIIDMGGDGAAFSPFSETVNLVLSFRLAEPLSAVEGTTAVREATLRASRWLAEATRDLAPPEMEVLELGPVEPGLPKVAYICFLLGLTDLHTSYVYGSPITSLPTLLHPNELADGAVVSANYHIAGIRNPTYLYQNSPVIARLRAEHGRTLDFVGVIVAQATISLYHEKERSALHAAKLARMLGAEAAVLSLDSGGNAFTDLMLACRACERLGLKTALVMPEYAGSGGGEPAFVDFVPEAVAIASTGNVDAAVTLPAVRRVLGGGDFPPSPTGSEPPITVGPAESFSTSLRLIQAATTGLGSWRLGGRGF